MEILAHYLGRKHRDRVGLHVEIDGVAHHLGRGRRRARQIDVRDLAERMHAGIGAPGHVARHPLAAETEDRGLEHLLQREAVQLALPADEAAAVVLERELVARHASTVPAGTARPRT